LHLTIAGLGSVVRVGALSRCLPVSQSEAMLSTLHKVDVATCDSDDSNQFRFVVQNTFLSVIDTSAAASGMRSLLRSVRSDSFLCGQGAMKLSSVLDPNSEGSESTCDESDDASDTCARSCFAHERAESEASESTMAEEDGSTELSSADEKELSCEEDEIASGDDLAEGQGYTPAFEAASNHDVDLVTKDNERLSRENAALLEKVRRMESSQDFPAAPTAGLPTHSGFAGWVPGQAYAYGSLWMPMEGACMNTLWIGNTDHTEAQSEVFGAQVSGVGPACQSPEDSRTTVMLKNLPNNYSRDMLVELLQREGFGRAYNFLYLPIDFKTQAALGYAFIDLASPTWAHSFWSVFDGFSNWTVPSRKVCFVTWCEPNQGLQTHIEQYRNSPVMHSSVPDDYKPLLLRDGQRVPFPPPTKAIRAPRARDCRLAMRRQRD